MKLLFSLFIMIFSVSLLFGQQSADRERFMQFENALKRCNYFYQQGDLARAELELQSILKMLGMEIASEPSENRMNRLKRAAFREGFKEGKKEGYREGVETASDVEAHHVSDRETAVDLAAIERQLEAASDSPAQADQEPEPPRSVIDRDPGPREARRDITYAAVKANYRRYLGERVIWQITFQQIDETFGILSYLQEGERRATCLYGDSEWDKLYLVFPRDTQRRMRSFSRNAKIEIEGIIRGRSDFGDPVIEFVREIR